MNTYFYSASTGGFYTPEIHGENIPADKVEITEQQWQDLLEGQSTGKVIAADATGAPVLQAPPEPSAEERSAQSAKQATKDSAIAKLVALGLTEDEASSLI
jgi:hypothetical protein